MARIEAKMADNINDTGDASSTKQIWRTGSKGVS